MAGEPVRVLTEAELRQSYQELKRVRDPLNGATALHAAPDVFDEALRLSRAYAPSDSGFSPRLTVRRNDLVAPGHIIGMRGLDIVLMIGPIAANRPACTEIPDAE